MIKSVLYPIEIYYISNTYGIIYRVKTYDNNVKVNNYITDYDRIDLTCYTFINIKNINNNDLSINFW